MARAADLVLFLGTPLPPSVIPPAPRPLPMVDLRRRDSVAALRDESLPGEDEPWRAVAAIRPDTAYVRAPRFLDVAGELLAAVAIIGGGMVLTGIATLL